MISFIHTASYETDQDVDVQHRWPRTQRTLKTPNSSVTPHLEPYPGGRMEGAAATL